MSFETIKYTVRASSLQPKGNGCPTGTPTEYIFQTFGATKSIIDISGATIRMLKSSDMQGLKAGNEEDPTYRATTYVSASYSCTGMRTTDGDIIYTAQEEHVSEFIDEDEVEGWS